MLERAVIDSNEKLSALTPASIQKSRGNALKLSHKGLILIAVPLIFEVVCFSFLYSALEESERQVKQEAFAKSTSQHLNIVAKQIMRASSSLYLYGVKGTDQYLDQYRAALNKIPDEFHTLHLLLDATPAKAAALTGMEETTNRLLGNFDEARRAARKRDLGAAMKYLSEVKELSIKATADTDTLTQEFQEIEQNSSESQIHARQALKTVLILAIVGSIALAIALYIYFNRETLQRLSTLLDNTNRFAKGDSLNPPLAGNDELAHLDLVFHEMSQAIIRSMREKQEFMAMITHDIRSPLTSVIGSLGLLVEPRMGFNLSEKAQEVVARAEINIQRLMRLVNDLLDIEKFESGKMKMHFKPAPFVYVIEQSLQMPLPPEPATLCQLLFKLNSRANSWHQSNKRPNRSQTRS